MSSALQTRPRARSSRSKSSGKSDRVALSSRSTTAESRHGNVFDPCSASASFFLYAQRNIILCLHHDTLALERRFEKHKEDVSIVSVDNISERGAGRLVVTYDVGQTAIVWDLFTGNEISRFASFEHIGVAAWMREGSIAFGNCQGNVTLFEPSTNEHVSARTIFDPITALAPAADCRTFAIGYQNGSILIANLQPSFTILHTLNTSRAPSPIAGLAWHGSSSKQKADMLATQTQDGDLRVWSVSKASQSEQPRIIRMLGEADERFTERNWFGWSKNGRIIHYSDGEMRTSDVRTKRVTSESVPVVDDVLAVTNYGPGATLFTVGRNYTVQQYDLASPGGPALVANIQHIPANAPPTPPDSLEERIVPKPSVAGLENTRPFMPIHLDQEASEDEDSAMSPLQRIAQEMDQIEEERRDQLGPLSPVSSRASSRASMSSASSYGNRRVRRAGRSSPSISSDGTAFSAGPSIRSGGDSISIRTGTSSASMKSSSSALRHELMRSPDEVKQMKHMDLFPFVKARLDEVKFRAPQYDQGELTPSSLRREMLSVVFGWDHDIEALIRDEYSRHKAGSASSVLLSKWLGDAGADALAQMVGSETMSSSDWMVLALSCQIGQGSQKHIGEAFVRRLLESNEIHPAVAILLGLGEHNDAIEAYVSRNHYLEAVLLTCLSFPNDWQRQSHLVRKWGEVAVTNRDTELAVRCFACTSIESSQQWFSPRALDEVYKAQQRILAPETLSPPLSPPSATNPNRLTTKNASLKLITSFSEQGVLKQPQQRQHQPTAIGTTPIVDTAVTPNGNSLWKRSASRGIRDQSETRTATPGGYARQRLPSRGAPSSRVASDDTPLVESRSGKKNATLESITTEISTSAILAPVGLVVGDSITVTQPATRNVRSASRTRGISRDRNRNDLHINTYNVIERDDFVSPHPSTSSRKVKARQSSTSHSKTVLSEASIREDDPISPSISTGGSYRSHKGRTIDRYINSLEEASYHASQQRSESRSRAGSTDRRSRSQARLRDHSEVRTQSDVRYVKPAKRSPSSPVPMISDQTGNYNQPTSETDELNRPSVTTEDLRSTKFRASARTSRSRSRPGVSTLRRPGSPEGSGGEESESKVSYQSSLFPRNRHAGVEEQQPITHRNRSSRSRPRRSTANSESPTSPSAMDSDLVTEKTQSRHRQRSTSRRPSDKHSRARSSSRKLRTAEIDSEDGKTEGLLLGQSLPLSPELSSEAALANKPKLLSRKELAAKELEERRLSLARRPSVPPIPTPSDLSSDRSATSLYFLAETGETLSSRSFNDIHRSQTAHLDAAGSLNWKPSLTPGSGPVIGLPATPRAMRHPKYHSSHSKNDPDKIPAVPSLPGNTDTLEPLTYQPNQRDEDVLGPLLPSTVYGQKPPLLRSASAPPEKIVQTSVRPSAAREDSNQRTSHTRRISDGEGVTGQIKSNMAKIIAKDQTVEGDVADHPPLIAELQHLVGPPPPPPPPTMFHPFPPAGLLVDSAMIDIVIEDKVQSPNNSPGETSTAVSRPVSTQRRTQTPDSLSSKWRNVTERIRSSSKSRTKSPPSIDYANFHDSCDTVLSSHVYQRTKSPQTELYAPYESIPPPPPPPPIGGSVLEHGTNNSEVVTRNGSAMGGYRNPKEIRANIPPDQLQQGVYHEMHSALI